MEVKTPLPDPAASHRPQRREQAAAVTEPLVSVVLPIHNQEDHIGGIVEEYSASLHGARIRHELILVPNACSDSSPAICAELAGRLPETRCLPAPSGGWGCAVRAGLAAARGDFLCYTNSARTMPEDLVTLILSGLDSPHTVTKANRIVREDLRRRLGSRLYNAECRLLFGFAGRDVNGTPKLFPRHLEKLLALTRDDDLIDAEFMAICQQEGYGVREIPIASTTRHGGASTTRFRSALRLYWGVFGLRRALSERSAAQV